MHGTNKDIIIGYETPVAQKRQKGGLLIVLRVQIFL